MSRQQFDDLFKAALWETYEKRCFWQNEPIEFFELEIDHVIPESLLDKPDKLKELLQGACLPDTFNILGPENLVPSCSKCNGKKSALEMAPQHLIFVTTLINKKLAALNDCLNAKKRHKSLEDVFLMIVRANADGKYSVSDLCARLRDGGYIDFHFRNPEDSLTLDRASIETAATAPVHVATDSRSASELVFVTRHALQALENLQMTTDDLRDLLLEGVEVRQTTDGTKAVVTRLRSGDALYIKYQTKGDRILVLSCHLAPY